MGPLLGALALSTLPFGLGWLDAAAMCSCSKLSVTIEADPMLRWVQSGPDGHH